MILIDGKVWDIHVIVTILTMTLSLSYLAFLLITSRIRPAIQQTHGLQGLGDFTVLYVIPCLNEAVVIGRSVKRLLEAHPGAHILVVDDGSEDGTGDIVAGLGDEHVHVLTRRLPQARQGKGEALNAAYAHVAAGNVVNIDDPSRVILTVVDADGRLEDGVADHVLPAFAGNRRVGAVQIGVRIVNRTSSLLARMQDLEFVLYTELYQRGRRHLGSVNLGGNGQFVRLSALQSLGARPWSRSLTEDLDLGVRIMMQGWRTDYVPTTAVHQQGLVSMSKWVRQRTRWFQGYLQAWTLLPALLGRLPWFTRADLLFHLTSPFVTLLGSVYFAAFIAGGVSVIDDWLYGRYLPQPWWVSMYLLMFVPSLVFGLFVYRGLEPSVGRVKMILLLHLYPFYSLLWFVAGWQGVGKLIMGKTSWAKTERLRERGPAELGVKPSHPSGVSVKKRFWTALLPGLVLALSAGIVSTVLTANLYERGERSVWVEHFVDGVSQGEGSSSQAKFPRQMGPTTGKRTIVLYDARGNEEARDLSGNQAAQLATHFGPVVVSPVSEYKPGQMSGFDAAVYVSTDDGVDLPDSFLADVRAGRTPMMWIGHNIEALAEGLAGEAYVASSGWDPTRVVEPRVAPTSLTYRGVSLDYPPNVIPLVPRGLSSTVRVLATLQCGTSRCADSAWAIQAGHLMYVADDAFQFTGERSRHLVVADLFYDLLGLNVAESRRASIRLEDVDALTPPHLLKGAVDILFARQIPFQVAVIPVRVERTTSGSSWKGVSLLDSPGLVDALEYAVERGGVLVQHGTSHQMGPLSNPYNGQTGADYEFTRAVCSTKASRPDTVEPCKEDSFISIAGPPLQDSLEDHLQRIQEGQRVFREVGLPVPTLFTTPHYEASPAAYRAMSQLGLVRYERTHYYAGQLSGSFDYVKGASLPAPYTTFDGYGGQVVPETIGNVSLRQLNGHPPRPVSVLLGNAQAQLAVRESVASMFFHPFLDHRLLIELVDGIRAQGFTFVPVRDVSFLPSAHASNRPLVPGERS